MRTWEKRMKAGLKRWTVLSFFEIIYFEIIYKFIGAIVITNILDGIKSSILNSSGLMYISQESIGEVLKSPSVLLQIIIALLVIAYYDYLEIATIVIYCEARWQGERTSLWKLFRQAIHKSVRVFHYKNLPIFISLIPVIALSVLPIAGGYLNRFQIPEFIMEYIRDNFTLFIIFLVVMIVINIILFFYIFSFPAVILRGEYFVGSLRSSKELLKSKKFKTVIYFIRYILLWWLIAFLGLCSMVLVLWGYSKVNHTIDGGRSLFQYEFEYWSTMGSTALDILGPVMLWPLVIYLYHKYRGERPSVYNQPPELREMKRKILYPVIMALTTVLLLGIYSETSLEGRVYSLANEDKISIVAHRAGADFAPENTIAALKEAIESEADIAEIDVQQTRDGVLVILHDASLWRTTGFDQKVWETDYSTIQTLDAGSSFSPAFAGESIPTLEEMLEVAKDKIKLMIELKSTGHEGNLVENTIHLIQQAEMEEQCMLASMDLNLLKRVKEIEPSIETVYITTLLISDDYDISFVDSYSIETSFLSAEMVAIVHSNNKKVYAWTANKEENMRKIIYQGADGLITDNPMLARYCLNTLDTNLLLEALTELLYGPQ